MVGQQKIIQNIPRDTADETEVWTSLHFVTTSLWPIKATLKVVKIDNFTLQNLQEGGLIEYNVIKYGSPIFHCQATSIELFHI